MSINYLSDNDFEISQHLDEINDSNITYQNIYNTQTEEFSSLLSILLTILNSIENINITYQNFIEIENEILPLINYRFDKYIRIKSSKIITISIILMNDKDQKKLKGISYIHILMNAIEKETSVLTVKNFLERLKEIIDSFNYEFLSKDEINNLFIKLNS